MFYAAIHYALYTMRELPQKRCENVNKMQRTDSFFVKQFFHILRFIANVSTEQFFVETSKVHCTRSTLLCSIYFKISKHFDIYWCNDNILLSVHNILNTRIYTVNILRESHNNR